MAEYTIPKPYRDFYVTDPYIATQKEVEDLQKYSNPFSETECGSIIHGVNTLPNKLVPVKVETKNIIPFPYRDTTNTNNGVTFTVNNDGTIDISGTTGETHAEFFLYFTRISSIIKTTEIPYTISESGNLSNVTCRYVIYDKDYFTLGSNTIESSSQTIDFKQYPNGVWIEITLTVSANSTASGTAKVQLEKGEVATSYSKFVEDGTETSLTTCGKNLLDFPADGVIETMVAIENLSLKKGSVFTISCGAVTKGSENDPCIVFRKNSSIIKTIDLVSNLDFSFVLTDDITTVYLYSNGAQYAASQGVTSTVKNLMLEFGYFKTAYESYNETIQNITTGTEVTVSQLDKHTNMQSGSLNIALSTNFIKKIDYEINEKVTIITGLFDNRPTNTKTYPIIYIATDKTDTDRTTFLPAGKSGATASNWIYI